MHLNVDDARGFMECGKCREMKPAMDFPQARKKYRPRKGGAPRNRIAPRARRLVWCKVCKSAYDKARRLATPLEILSEQARKKTQRHILDGRHAYWQSLSRARLKEARIKLSLAEFREVQAIAKCHWCEIDLHMSFRNIDHIVPLSEGGEHTRSNLVAACANCNMRRAWERKTKYGREK